MQHSNLILENLIAATASYWEIIPKNAGFKQVRTNWVFSCDNFGKMRAKLSFKAKICIKMQIKFWSNDVFIEFCELTQNLNLEFWE